MMKISSKIGAALASAAVCLSCAPCTYALSPDTGNTESRTYIIVLIVAGVLIAAAIIAGVLTKKKK